MSVYPANRYGEKDSGACGMVGIIERKGRLISGSKVIDSLVNMKERGNGLGSGYVIYGAYPEFKDYYAFHLMYQDGRGKVETEELLRQRFRIVHSEPVPVSKVNAIKNPPEFYRYFAELDEKFKETHSVIDDYIVNTVMKINEFIDGAFVVSSGKNMAVFKGVGFPEEIAEFFKVHNYKGYILVGHTRFPTNTPGWWGGAHPFTILDWSIVHNGEISSYGTNRRYVEMYGYRCTMLTDTEVVAYLLDFLVRKKGLSLETAAAVFAPPFWKDLDDMPEEQKKFYTALRMTYGRATLNGPFAIIMGFSDGFMALNDRIKLRPLVVGRNGSTTVVASEESAIRVVVPEPEDVWAPPAGKPVIVRISRGE
jgi:glutamate synthase domain-containing protein 1